MEKELLAQREKLVCYLAELNITGNAERSRSFNIQIQIERIDKLLIEIVSNTKPLT